jgi:hypothetical protein
MLISSPIISSGEGGGLGGFDFGVDAEMDPELALVSSRQKEHGLMYIKLMLMNGCVGH